MKITRILAAIFATLLPLAAGATTLVIPASGTGPGANDSHWQTELTLHNLSATPVTAILTFHDVAGSAGTSNVTVAPRATVAIADVVATRFGRGAATGAIEVTLDSAFAQKLTVSSRTFNKHGRATGSSARRSTSWRTDCGARLLPAPSENG